MVVTLALTLALSPEEREQRLVNAGLWGVKLAVAAFWLFVTRAKQTA